MLLLSLVWECAVVDGKGVEEGAEFLTDLEDLEQRTDVESCRQVSVLQFATRRGIWRRGGPETCTVDIFLSAAHCELTWPAKSQL